MYLRERDYVRQIQADNLTAIIGNDSAIRLMDEMASQAETISYLTQRYDTELEFSDTTVWSYSLSYKALQRFYLNYNDYDSTATYHTNDLVTYAGNCYICTGTTTGIFDLTKWTLLGAKYDMFFGALPAEYYDLTKVYQKNDTMFYKDKIWAAKAQNIGIMPTDPLNGFANWGNGAAYSISSGTLPTDANKYTKGDNRSQQLVMVVIDIALYHIHSRISPRNIPQLRMDRYDNAIAWLKEAGGQNNAITADIRKLITSTGTPGQRTIWGGHIKNNNTY